jgi:hypothetical protein
MSAKIISHVFTGKSLVVVSSNGSGVQNQIVESSHINWKPIMALYKAGKYLEMLPLLSVTGAITTQSGGKFTVKDGVVYYNGQPTHGYMFERILFFLKELPKQYPRLVKFAENLYLNPSDRARNELYKFLEKGNMPITDDGCFLAYKGVKNDYYSITAGKVVLLQGKQDANGYIYNAVGEVIEVKRECVDANPNRDCSNGLHAGSFNYADGFKSGGRLMIVKINPRDVVSVPHADANKLRCCLYEVIAEHGKKLDEARDSNFARAAKVRYTVAKNGSLRGPNGQFVSPPAN